MNLDVGSQKLVRWEAKLITRCEVEYPNHWFSRRDFPLTQHLKRFSDHASCFFV